MKVAKRNSRRGGSVLEMALLLPWYMFLFVGVYDWGFYAHALVSTESAARVAATYTATSAATAADSSGACLYALEELRVVANITSAMTTCGAAPIVVTATAVNAASADGLPASQVAVTYTTVQLIAIPGLLPSKATFYRVVQMRLRS